MMPHERFRFRDLAALKRKIAALGLDIPVSADISILFSHVVVNRKVLPNRFAVLPMEGADGDATGRPTELTGRRYKRYAEGGASLIWFEATAVTPEGRSNPRQLWINPESRDGFKRLVKETRLAAHRKFGRDHDLILILQLTHSGRHSRPHGRPAPVIAQRNPLLDAKLGLPPDYPVVSDAALDALQEDYASAARLAHEAGFDGVDIKACHGYLVSELLASFTRSGSRYGGSFENRSRFLVETSERIKQQVRGIFVTGRLSLYDAVPFPYGFGVNQKDPAEPDLDEPVRLIKKLREVDFPVLAVSLGVPAHQSHFGRPSDKPLIGQKLPDEHPLVGVARWLRLAAHVQKTFPTLPVVGGGYSWLRHLFPHVAAAVVESEMASLIGLGRGSIAFPDWVNALAADGVLDPRRVCVTCSKCSQMLRAGRAVGCAVQDAGVYQTEYREARKRARQVRKAEKKTAQTAGRRKRQKA
jgi:2,4-dienoyl-CoA reductase-like NADH-dependent reductase (Old Yellow Enzyme family)